MINYDLYRKQKHQFPLPNDVRSSFSMMNKRTPSNINPTHVDLDRRTLS